MWIIRTTWTWPHEPGREPKVMYYMTPAMWTASPIDATMFMDYDAGSAHMIMMQQRDKASKGWFDKREEVIEVVPLYGEILNSPNGVDLHVKDGKVERKDRKR